MLIMCTATRRLWVLQMVAGIVTLCVAAPGLCQHPLEDAGQWTARADQLSRDGKNDEAIEAARRASDIYKQYIVTPDGRVRYARSLSALARFYMVAGKPDQAEKSFLEAIRVYPD